MDMNQLLESIYSKNASDSSLEKTAEQAFLGAIDIDTEPATAENPFASLSLDELVKLANDLEAANTDSDDAAEEADETEVAEEAAEEVAEEVAEDNAEDNADDAAESEEASDEELNKTAAAMFGGQLMAHAVVHELGLIKEAVANGICRVCKEMPMDIEGSSVCSACSGGN